MPSREERRATHKNAGPSLEWPARTAGLQRSQLGTAAPARLTRAVGRGEGVGVEGVSGVHVCLGHAHAPHLLLRAPHLLYLVLQGVRGVCVCVCVRVCVVEWGGIQGR